MKIPDANLNGLSNSGLGGASGAKALESVTQRGSGPGSGRRTDGSTDEVQLSGLSQQLRAADQESPERLAKLEQVRTDVQSGQYQADPQTIAQSVVKNALGESS
jgi:flagellar biosynthesis anti-sigma factor FlgM